MGNDADGYFLARYFVGLQTVQGSILLMEGRKIEITDGGITIGRFEFY